MQSSPAQPAWQSGTVLVNKIGVKTTVGPSVVVVGAVVSTSVVVVVGASVVVVVGASVVVVVGASVVVVVGASVVVVVGASVVVGAVVVVVGASVGAAVGALVVVVGASVGAAVASAGHETLNFFPLAQCDAQTKYLVSPLFAKRLFSCLCSPE